MILFFGCRKKSEDYIYEDELLSYSQDGTIQQLHVAFSRDQVRYYWDSRDFETLEIY